MENLVKERTDWLLSVNLLEYKGGFHMLTPAENAFGAASWLAVNGYPSPPKWKLEMPTQSTQESPAELTLFFLYLKALSIGECLTLLKYRILSLHSVIFLPTQDESSAYIHLAGVALVHTICDGGTSKSHLGRMACMDHQQQ